MGKHVPLQNSFKEILLTKLEDNKSPEISPENFLRRGKKYLSKYYPKLFSEFDDLLSISWIRYNSKKDLILKDHYQFYIGVLHNVVLEHLRNSKFTPIPIDEIDPPAMGDDRHPNTDLLPQIFYLIETVLPQREKLVLQLIYIDGMGLKEIASKIKISPNKIYDIKYRALKTLKESLKTSR